MDASSDGTHGESRRDADAPGAWRSDKLRGAQPRAAARCPAQPPSSASPESVMPTEPSGPGESRTCSDGADRKNKGSVAKFDFWGKIQKSGVRNSMTYRLTNSRKSNFATEPDFVLTIVTDLTSKDFCSEKGEGIWA